jgi:hypothetical protein
VNAKLPPGMRLPSGWDVVKLVDGSWVVMERNILEVGDLYPDYNVKTVQLVAGYQLGPTPLEVAFGRFQQAEGFEAKSKRLEEFFARPAFKLPEVKRESYTEYLLDAKSAFYAEFKKAPDFENAKKLLKITRKFGLADQYTASEFQNFTTVLLQGGVSVRELEDLVGPFEVLYRDSMGYARLMLKNYDNRYIAETVAPEIKKLLPAGRQPSAKELERAVRSLTAQMVISTEALAARPEVIEQAAATRSTPALWIFNGSQKSLENTMIRAVRRLYVKN